MTVVYLLKCPKTQEPRYVGEGGQTRPYDHLRKVKKGQQTSNPRLTKWIERLLAEQLEPVIEVVQSDLSKQAALDLEEKLIRQFGRRGLDRGGVLLNIAERGLSYNRSGVNNPFYGKKHSAATLKKMSDAKRGKDRGEAFRETMREVAAQRPPQSIETRMKRRASMLARWELKRQTTAT